MLDRQMLEMDVAKCVHSQRVHQPGRTHTLPHTHTSVCAHGRAHTAPSAHTWGLWKRVQCVQREFVNAGWVPTAPKSQFDPQSAVAANLTLELT
jgi:hypothetical protein